MRAIICVGISGSGKSTWALEQTRIPETYNPVQIINRDETRWVLSGKEGWNGPNAYKFHSDMEDRVTKANYASMFIAAERGLNIIVADTNLNPKTRDRLWKQCEALGYEVAIKEFPISFQEACRRDKGRGVFAVGEAVLMKQWEQWVKYHAAKGEGMWEEQRSKNA